MHSGKTVEMGGELNQSILGSAPIDTKGFGDCEGSENLLHYGTAHIF